MEKGVQRWIVDISKWNPSPENFSSALSVLPRREHSSILRFMRMEDKKMALASRLLQYALVHEMLGTPYDKIVIKRTEEGKPYLEGVRAIEEFPNFNFNVSHQGDYVAIAAEPLCLVGVDVVHCIKPKKETVSEFIQNFSSYFSSLEWDAIKNAGSSDEILNEFYRYWSLKEAFVKATGSGLGYYGVDKLEFHHKNWSNISVTVDGEAMKDWRFWILELPERHWVSVARGHPRFAVQSYKATINQAGFSEEEYQKGLCLPNVGFATRTVEQLVAVLKGADNLVLDETLAPDM